MPVNRVPNFVPSLLELMESSRRSITLTPLNLGGASGSGGGSGTPSGGVLGQLIQGNVTYDTSELSSASGSSSLLDNLNHLRLRASGGRKMWNRSGGTLLAGSVVVYHASANDGMETTTSEADTDVLGALQEVTLSGSAGIVIFNGYAPQVRVSGAVSRGDYLYSATTAGMAVASASGSNVGCFGRVVTAASGSLVAAILWPPTLSAGGGSGGSGAVATDVLWDAKGDLAVGTGANTAQKLTVGSNGQLLVADSTTTTGLRWAALSGSVAIDPLWDAKGDIAVATGDNAATRLPVGSNGQMLRANSGTATGLEWFSATGSLAIDHLWDAKGDLAVATGNNAAARLPVGNFGQFPMADSGATTGIRWMSGSALTGVFPSGPAGGDLAGTYPNPTVSDDSHAHGSTTVTLAHSNLTGIGSGDHHAAVTLAADADALLGLSTQQLTLDSQDANKFFLGPASGASADPTFRVPVYDDLGTGGDGSGDNYLADDMTWKTVTSSGSSAPVTPMAVARATVGSGQVIADGTTVRLDFSTVVYDTDSGITTGGSWQYEAPVTGYYLVNCMVVVEGTFVEGNTTELVLVKNVTPFATLSFELTYDIAADIVQLKGSALIQLNAGQTCHINLINGQSANIEISGVSPTGNYIDIIQVR